LNRLFDIWGRHAIGSLRREEGQALVEYALILFLVALVCIGALTLVGTKLQNIFQLVVNAF